MTACFLFLQVRSVAGMFSRLLCSNVVFQMSVQMDDAYAKVIEFPGDGSVRVWKYYTQQDRHKIATTWKTTQGHRSGARSVNVVVDWQQLTGYLVMLFMKNCKPFFYDKMLQFRDICSI